MMRAPSDASARQQALNPALNFVVQAPAGSGKTELLTLRILSLLAVCKNPEEILAITFTRKAAAEMRQRVIEALRFGKCPAPDQTEPHNLLRWNLATAALKKNKAQAWNLLENPSRLRIQTIDGFCRSLAQKQPVSSHLGTLPETFRNSVMSEKTLLAAARESIQQLENAKNNPELSAALEYILSHLDNDIPRLERLLLQLLNKREQWLFYLANLSDEETVQENNKKLLDDLLQEPYQALLDWQAEILKGFNHAIENLNASDNNPQSYKPLKKFPDPIAECRDDWNGLLSFLSTKDGLRQVRGINKKMGVPTDSPLKKDIQSLFEVLNEQKGLAEILLDAKTFPLHPISPEQINLFKSIRLILRDCVGRLRVLFGKVGATDYTEISLSALNALSSNNTTNTDKNDESKSDDAPSDLTLKLDYTLKHILIDEFQDTSHLQYTLLKKLTDGWQANDGHSLFLVGDPMQSCYQFRNADVRIFLEVMDKGLSNIQFECLTLSENFRSSPAVVDWNNHIFTQAFPPLAHKNHSAVPYSPSSAFKIDDKHSRVECFQFFKNTEQKIQGSESEPSKEELELNEPETQKVITLIQKTQQQNPSDSIAILVRSRTHARKLFPAMKAAKIDWQAVDMNSLDQNMTILDLMSLSRALLYPADHLAWLALLRSPLAGFSLNDLHALCHIPSPKPSNETSSSRTEYLPLILALQEKQSVNHLSETGKIILQRIAPVLENAWHNQQRKSLPQWLEGIWYALGGPASANPAQVDNSKEFFEVLQEHEEAGRIIDWPLFEQAISKLYGNNASPADNAVQVMTMHKAKGLEFDCVILPGLASQPRNDDPELLLWNEYFLENQQSLLLFGGAESVGCEKDSRYQFLKSLEQHKRKHESIRLLYVACTRAIKNLYLLATVKERKNKKTSEMEVSAPHKNSLLSPIWGVFEKQSICEKNHAEIPSSNNNDIKSTDTKITETDGLEYISRLMPNWTPLTFSEGDLLADYRGKIIAQENNLPDLTSTHNFIARQTGTLIHQYLQIICEQGVHRWPEDALKKKYGTWEHKLKQLGLNSQYAKSYCMEIEKTLKNVLQSKQGQWILDNSHQESACELELLYKNKISIIDRTFIDGKTHTRWIIDYKTTTNNSTQETEQYKSQLERYKKLFSLTESIEIKTAVYFPQQDKLQIIA